MKKQSQIITVPDKSLSKETKTVTSFGSDLKNQADILKNTLEKNADYGIGLAANQLGYNTKMFVVEFEDPEKKDIIPLTFFINPQIVEKSNDFETLDEGCLSVPNIFLPVKRSTKIKVKAQDTNGKMFKLTAKGLFARLIQHEYDHLHGILFVDRAREKLLEDNPQVKNLKIVFIGTGEFAHLILEGLILLGFNIEKVITEKPKPQGRKQEICDSPVGKIAKDFNKNLIETENIKSLELQVKNTDLIILTDFGQIIPENIINIPKLGTINIHPSLLPKYRGPSPIQSSILDGEKETGVSIIRVTPGIDEGPVLTSETAEIWPEDNCYSLENRLSNLGLKMLIKIIPEIQKGNLKEIPQNNELATYTKKFKKTDGEINWKENPEKINNMVRSFYPWPIAYTFINNKRLLILQSHVDNNKLVIDAVKPEGKGPMLWADFLRGYHGPKPEWFSKISIEN